MLDKSPQRDFACIIPIDLKCDIIFWPSMAFDEQLAPKQMKFKLFRWGDWFRSRVPPQVPSSAQSQTPPQPSTSFEVNFRNEEDKAKFECFYAKRKVKEIWIIKLVDFVDAKFKYLTWFEKFEGMSYLTTQCLVRENLL